jgi:Aminotransferase class-V
MQEPIYLDHNATTPVDRRVLEKMLPYFCEVYGNASSIDHLHGVRAKDAVNSARESSAIRDRSIFRSLAENRSVPNLHECAKTIKSFYPT